MISAQKEKLTFPQILIFAWGMALIAGVLLFFLFVDAPADRRALDIQERVHLVENRIRWVTQTIEVLQDPQAVHERFMTAARELDRKFPENAEKSLAMLADYANKFGVRLSEIQTATPHRVLTSHGNKLGADGKTCVGVPVSMKFKSEYFNWVKYFMIIRKILPAFLVIQKVTIENNLSPTLPLEGTVDLNLYLLEP